jgi:hypothetical protein
MSNRASHDPDEIRATPDTGLMATLSLQQYDDKACRFGYVTTFA